MFVKLFIFILILIGYKMYAEETTLDVIVSYPSPIYLKVLSGLKYSTDTKLNIKYLNQYKQELESSENLPSDKKIVLTIGNTATTYVRQNTNHITLFALASYSKESLEYERGGLCGILAEVPIEKIFQSVRDFFPERKKIYTFYSKSSKSYYTEYEKNLDMLFGLFFKKIEVKDDLEFKNEVYKLAGKAEVFFVHYDSIYTRENFEVLSEYAKKNNILPVSNIASLTDLGLSYSIDQDYFEIGIKIGNLLNQIQTGQEKCELGPISFPSRQLFKMNSDYLAASNIVIPEKMKTRFEIDTWNNSAIDLYSKGKIQTSLNLFQYVLRKDPSNETTNYYIKLIYNEKYESKIKTYLKEAESLFEKKLYQEAARVYDKIFKLNPYYPGIKEKKQEAMFLDSERKKEEALAKETAGQVFSAILLYQEAVQIYPENKSAKESLFRLRQKLTPQIPEYHEKGLDLYNKRRYADSISIYENILLIDSEDKRAKEYLRLSKEKKEALHKLMNCKIDRENPCKL